MKKPGTRFWRGFLLIALLGILLGYNYSIIKKEQLLDTGEPLLVALGPVDPRSLMQGDYMILDFSMQWQVFQELRKQSGEQRIAPHKGIMVVALKNDEHVFSRIYSGEKLAEGERLLEYKVENNRLKIAGGTFFFEEGLGRLYEGARYARLVADENGKALVSGLMDWQKRPLNKDYRK